MSSSSDEDLSKFKEATDVKLFNDSFFVSGKAEPNAIAHVKPSQRHLDAPDENRTDLKVTPGFQKHVASHLMKILDSSLDQDIVSTCTPDHDSNGNCTTEVPVPQKKPEGGIKLFGASAAFLANCNIVPPPPTKRRKRGRKFACISSESEDESSSNEAESNNPSKTGSPVKAKSLGPRDETELSEQFAACAVTSDWILNGDAVKGWAPFKTKEPIQGEATPDLLKITVLYKREMSKKKHKKEKLLKEKSRKKVKRGKRGGKHRKNKVKDDDNLENGQEFFDGDSLTKAPKKKKRKKESYPECIQEKNEYICVKKRHSKKCEEFRGLLREFAEKEGLEGTSRGPVRIRCSSGGKKKKRKVKMKLSNAENRTDFNEVLNDLFKKVKKEMKKRRKGREKSLPLAATAEDEGFDSDPTKADKKRKVERKLLKARLKKQKKRENNWQNSMEFLSKDLANLVMTNVKQD